MIVSIINSHQEVIVEGDNFTDMEKHFLSNFTFILERNVKYNLKDALYKIQNYYNNPRVDKIVNVIKKQN